MPTTPSTSSDNGKWIRSKTTPQDMLKQEQENIRDSKTSCRHVRDELVNGEAGGPVHGAQRERWQ